jgi:phage terminase small subunit
MKGRKSHPTVLHRLRGTFQPVRHGNRLDPKTPGELRKPPAWLSPAQARRFKELLRQAPRRVLRQIDSGVLASYVVCEDTIAKANIAQQEHGRLLDRSEKGQPMVGAHLKVLRTYIPILRQLAGELGFTPVARSGIRAAEVENGDPDGRWAFFDELQRKTSNTYAEVRAIMAHRVMGNEEVVDADEAAEVPAAAPQASESDGAPEGEFANMGSVSASVSSAGECAGAGLRQGLGEATSDLPEGTS